MAIQIKSKARNKIDLNKINLRRIDDGEWIYKHGSQESLKNTAIKATAPLCYEAQEGSMKWRIRMEFTLQGYTLQTTIFHKGQWVVYDHGYTQSSTWDELAQWIITAFFYAFGNFQYSEEEFYDTLHSHLSDEFAEAYANLYTDGIHQLREARRGKETKTFGK